MSDLARRVLRAGINPARPFWFGGRYYVPVKVPKPEPPKK